MKYKDLIDFDPIETVIQLRESAKEEKARTLIKTYIISEHMHDQISEIIVQNLRFDNNKEHKGIFIIGNYGTGKSHLMSVIGSVAEKKELLELVSNDESKEALRVVAGKFKVIRVEIGSTLDSLRDILVRELEKSLSSFDIDYKFPPQSEITNHKDCFQEMMAKFEERYPDAGLLLIVDELLDYLRTRRDTDLILDLNFLRELGEICNISKFRFMAGLQEALFESPRFQFASDELERVKDRFVQAIIARTDVEFVVSNRMLKKNPEQLSWIQKYLEKFKPMYPLMNDRFDDFVRLFPVHPSYIGVFQEMKMIEKSEVLTTLSDEIKKIVDNEVPEDYPGLITYDLYWKRLSEGELRTNPDVRAVVEAGEKLHFLIEQQMEKKAYIENALRIIRALCVYRLASLTLDAEVGLTASRIKDDILIYSPDLPVKDSDFLETHVESVIREIIRTVTGMFISKNEENGQYYLDLKKTIDYEEKIRERIPSLDERVLDRYLFEILKILMQETDEPYVSGFRIWEYGIIWRRRHVGRKGYLFMGTPNERSTAQPPRDFYIYFLPVFEKKDFDDELKDDEVFIILDLSDEIKETVRHYAASKDLAATSDTTHRSNYNTIAEKDLKKINSWFIENASRGVFVRYKGEENPLATFGISNTSNFRDMINNSASQVLEKYFDLIYEDYPAFENLVTSKTLEKSCEDAVRAICGYPETTLAKNILNGLELKKGDELQVGNSRYARWIIKEMEKKEGKNVLRRDELFEKVSGKKIGPGGSKVVYYEKTVKYNLEPELLAVVIAALVRNGDIVVYSRSKKKVGAANLEDLKREFDALVNFLHLEKPKGINKGLLREILRTLGEPEGLAEDEYLNEAVRRMNEKADSLVNEAAELQGYLSDNPAIGNIQIFSKSEIEGLKSKLNEGKKILEKLLRFDTKGKLVNLDFSTSEIEKLKESLDCINALRQIRELSNQYLPLISYLNTADGVLRTDSKVLMEYRETKADFEKHIQDPESRLDYQINREYISKFEKLKDDAIEEYFHEHNKYRLS
ncbi:TPA: ATP-binding protein, partial [Candidatus Bathyarchaeota archaeon]|nr:ATP-binding protein [Candidatus Bathyarchaeota archaeon]